MRTATVLVVAVLLTPVAVAAETYPLPASSAPIQDALAFLRSQQRGDGSIGDDSVTAWVVMGLAAAGEDPNAWRAPGSGFSPVDYLERVTPRLATATDWERQLLAAAAAGANVHAFGGEDLVARVLSFHDGEQFGSTAALNDDAFAILSLSAAGIPGSDPRIQSAASFVAIHQGLDGGWSYAVGGVSGVDDTAASLMALARADYAADAPAVQRALDYLHTQQLPDGGFPSVTHGGTVSNSASDAWAIGALVAFGEDPDGEAWSVAGQSVVDNLLLLQEPDGSFRWDGVQRVGPIWMTAYALPALAGKPYPVA
jgi:iron complex transport system substrate-binding protein